MNLSKLSRKQISLNNAKNYQATKHAKQVRKWQVKKGTCQLLQRPTGDWLAAFTSSDEQEYIVALHNTPKKAIANLKIDTTPA